MPFKDPEARRAAQRRYYQRRYQDEEFRAAESVRKAAWYQDNREEVRQRAAAYYWEVYRKVAGIESPGVKRKRAQSHRRALSQALDMAGMLSPRELGFYIQTVARRAAR